MKDIQHLRELIFGLIIISPIACQSSPTEKPEPTKQALVAPTPSEEKTTDSTLSPAGPTTVAQTSKETKTSTDKTPDTTTQPDVKEVVKQPLKTHNGYAKKQKQGPLRCLNFKEIKAIQDNFYKTELNKWKQYQQYKKQYKTNRRWSMSKPIRPKKLKTCPDTLILSQSRTPCRMITNMLIQDKTATVPKGKTCCFRPPPRRGPQRPCGRLFYVEDDVSTAQTDASTTWMGDVIQDVPAMPASLRHAAGEAWLEDALEEHASIAAFSRATLELMAMGAPAELLAKYQHASLEEIHHAQLCFSLASALLERDISAGVLDVEGPRDNLDTIIKDVLWGGCVGESIAALCAQRALSQCTWPEAKNALVRISNDEASHAALAWSTLYFFASKHPAKVLRALDRAQPRPFSTRTMETQSSQWQGLGRLTQAQEAQATDDAWAQLISPMIEQLREHIHEHVMMA